MRQASKRRPCRAESTSGLSGNLHGRPSERPCSLCFQDHFLVSKSALTGPPRAWIQAPNQVLAAVLVRSTFWRLGFLIRTAEMIRLTCSSLLRPAVLIRSTLALSAPTHFCLSSVASVATALTHMLTKLALDLALSTPTHFFQSPWQLS